MNGADGAASRGQWRSSYLTVSVTRSTVSCSAWSTASLRRRETEGGYYRLRGSAAKRCLYSFDKGAELRCVLDGSTRVMRPLLLIDVDH